MQISEIDLPPKGLCLECFKELIYCCNFIDKYQHSEQVIHRMETGTTTEKIKSLWDEINEEEIELSDLKTEPVETVKKKTHMVKESYKCGFCEKCFTRKGHVLEKSRNCSFCFKCFTAVQCQRFQSCSFSEKRSAKKQNLIFNERMHTGGKLSKRDFCEKCFGEGKRPFLR